MAPIEGLSVAAAAERLRIDGPNELRIVRPPAMWRQLLAQLFHFFAILLWVAGALAIVGGMAELGVAIFLVVITNGVFAFLQEHRAERAAQRLQALVPRRIVVRRSGEWIELDARDLVAEDLVQLAAGDGISADARLVGGKGLLVDTSTLTGESVPVAIAEGELVFAGTFVIEGEAQASVVATGARTRLSGIAELTQGRRRPPTPLARELERLVRGVAVVAVGMGLLFFAVGAYVGLPFRDGFLFAIGVAVALVPEGLLPTVTLSLAMGASRMAKRGALVRRLEAVETLGATTFICTDKTGTLTMNQMSVVEVWTPAGVCAVRGEGYAPVAELAASPEARAAAAVLALASVRASTGRAILREGDWVARGDPMEAALHALALRLGVNLEASARDQPETSRFSFDPRRRRMSVVTESSVYVKGAPDAVLGLCGSCEAAGPVATDMASRGLRVIAVASRSLDASAPRNTAEQVESNLELLGLVGMLDPPRPDVGSAIAKCERAGIRVIMVTGDHPKTACGIAREVGLRANLVVAGEDLPDDDAILGALVDRDGVLVCRVSPEQKLRIAKVLQARGHVVAMTGDGVNDGPALHQADVGIAMGRSGTDVARAAADLVLLDDAFETIVQAVEEGRSTFANIRRFLTYHLADNVAELAPFVVWALSGGRFPLAIGVLQILTLDLLTDQLPALALGAEPPSPRVLIGPPPRKHLLDAALLLRAFIVLGLTEALLEMAAFAGVLSSLGWDRTRGLPDASVVAVASGTAFVAIVFGQTGAALACRSDSRAAYRVSLRNNPLLIAALLVTWGLAAILLYVPSLARLLGQSAPTSHGFALAALAFPLVILVDAAYKASTRRWRAFKLASPSAHDAGRNDRKGDRLP